MGLDTLLRVDEFREGHKEGGGLRSPKNSIVKMDSGRWVRTRHRQRMAVAERGSDEANKRGTEEEFNGP